MLLALDEESGKPLYVAFVKHEKVQDYKDAISSIEERGYTIRGIVIDGMQQLFKEFSSYKIQMCQFHMRQIVKRHLTQNPKLLAARELKVLMGNLTKKQKGEFEEEYRQWKAKWKDTLERRSLLKSGKRPYTHKRLRTAMHSVDFYLPYLFTYQLPECKGMQMVNGQ